MSNWKQVYNHWKSFKQLDPSLNEALTNLENDQAALEDAFYKELTFGTGGMRGILGPGTNRMNLYTIRKAVSGLAKYILANNAEAKDRGIVIAYDSRYMSKEFAVEAAKVLGTYEIKAYVFESLRPTPLLSFAVRHLGTAAGIMITASHNPPEYNGFKVYNEDGGQMVPEEAEKVIDLIKETGDELTIPVAEQGELEERALLIWTGKEIDEAYLAQLLRISKLDANVIAQEKDLPIIFTPLHGTAHDLVLQGLEQLRFSNVEVVKEQALPDPEFSTVESPNPEEHQAFTLAMKLGKEKNAAILLGTDPDADRLGVAVRNATGDYTVLTGNQLGSLFIDYVLSHADSEQLKNARVLKTIVTTELGRAITDSYGVTMVDTLTGFKYIAEKIRQYETTGETFLFGFEESYGYLLNNFVRDKDAVQAAIMASEMAYYWQQQGKSLLEALDYLYEKYGYYKEAMSSLTLTGKAGSEKIATIMETFRNNPLKEIAGYEVEKVEDYLTSERLVIRTGRQETIDLPKENVLKFILTNNRWVCLRPSGTEPKIKCYFGVCEDSLEASEKLLASLKEVMDKKMTEIIA